MCSPVGMQVNLVSNHSLLKHDWSILFSLQWKPEPFGSCKRYLFTEIDFHKAKAVCGHLDLLFMYLLWQI